MNLRVEHTEVAQIAHLRELLRHEAGCQIVRDSILPRGLADPYVILVDGQASGYGGVWNQHFPGRLMEFFCLPELRPVASQLCRELLTNSGATRMEAQTNLPLALEMLEAHGEDLQRENLLFEDGPKTHLTCPGSLFRRRRSRDVGPDGEWVIELDRRIVAAGGALDHYNPPFVDLYLEVIPAARRQGVGSYLVQELRRISEEAGTVPAARCDPSNHASRRTLTRGGLVECGSLLAGRVKG